MPRCPSCFTPLTRVEEENSIKLATCSNCMGSWISAVALLRLTRMEAGRDDQPTPSAPDASLQDLAAVVAESDSKDTLRCPQCEIPMKKDRMHPMIPVTIDRCSRCGFIWLDAGELNLIRRLNREMMTSTDPEIVRRREKISTIARQWDAHIPSAPDSLPSLSPQTTPDLEVFDILTFLLDR